MDALPEKVEEEATETETSESDDDDDDADDKNDSDDSGEDVASLKKSPVQKNPKFASNFGSLKSSSTSSHVCLVARRVL